MSLIANVLVGILAVLHVGFLVLEMFIWNTPAGHKRFRMTPEYAERSKSLAANQGLYNGFLVAGLVWGLLISDPTWSWNVKVFFASLVLVAGVYGGLTALRSIFVMQALPAALTLAALFISRGAR